MKQHFRTGCKSLHFVVLCAFLSMAALAGISAFAQGDAQEAANNPAQASGPLVCDEPEFDFGERDNLSKVKHTFSLRNAGDSPLTINRIISTCGCTVAKFGNEALPSHDAASANGQKAPTDLNKTLEPGETVPLEVDVSLDNRKGAFQKHIYVLYGDETQTRTKLTIKGTAVERLRITPQTVNLAYSAAETPTETTAIIESLDESARFAVTDIGTTSKHLELEVESAEDGTKHTLHVRTRPPLPIGTHPAKIHLFTDNERYPRIEIPVALRVVDKLEVVPEEVVIYDRGISDAGTAVRFVNVMPGSAREFTITGVETPVDSIVAEVIPRPGNRFLVKLANVPVSQAMEGKEIVLLTDIPGKERVTIPIRVKEYPTPEASGTASATPGP